MRFKMQPSHSHSGPKPLLKPGSPLEGLDNHDLRLKCIYRRCCAIARGYQERFKALAAAHLWVRDQTSYRVAAGGVHLTTPTCPRNANQQARFESRVSCAYTLYGLRCRISCPVSPSLTLFTEPRTNHRDSSDLSSPPGGPTLCVKLERIR